MFSKLLKNTIDTIIKPFLLNWEVVPSKWVQKITPAWYSILIDEIDLAAWESMQLQYVIRMQPVTFWNIKAWLLAPEWEVWDDNFWDIIINPDDQNCSQTVDIFRSIGARAYRKGLSEPKCDPQKLKLPDILEKNKIDINPKNGVPDFTAFLINFIAASDVSSSTVSILFFVKGPVSSIFPSA